MVGLGFRWPDALSSRTRSIIYTGLIMRDAIRLFVEGLRGAGDDFGRVEWFRGFCRM